MDREDAAPEPEGGGLDIVEGGTRLRVPRSRTSKGPGAYTEAVFFNPAMALSRDVGVLVVAARARENWRILDGLAGAGARGVRYAVESMPRALARASEQATASHEASNAPRGGRDADGGRVTGAQDANEAGPAFRLTLNDYNPSAAALCEFNALHNGVAARVTRRRLSALLWEEEWHFVEVDPFGSPAPFLDAATRAVLPGCLLALTATDTGALFGTYAPACRRRYLAEPLRCEFGHDLALRILAGAVTRQAARHEIGMEPILAHIAGHAYRVYARAAKGAARADAALSHLGWAWYCHACGSRGTLRGDAPPGPTCPTCGGAVASAGPLWTGHLVDRSLMSDMAEALPHLRLARPDDATWLLSLLMGEADAPPLFYDAHEAASRAKVDPWPVSAILDALYRDGFRAARSHISPNGIKTDATMAELIRVLQGDREEVYRMIEAAEAETRVEGAAKSMLKHAKGHSQGTSPPR
ncbi:MAG: hypothetical protein ACYDDF_02685 [Thermoplasmatota archaeon]